MFHKLARSLRSTMTLCCIVMASPTLAEHDHQPGVTLYEHNDFRGRSITFSSDVPSLAATYFGQDRASSIEVDRGCRVTLYRDRDFRGPATVLTADAPALGETRVGNDAVSSLEVWCRGSGDDYPWGERGVVLYEHEDFRGRNEFFDRDDRDLGDNPIGNDRVSSIRVARGCEARLYEDAGFRGRVSVLEADVANLGPTRVGNDAVSSIEVSCRRRRPDRRPRRGVVLYEDVQFRGRSEIFFADDRRLRDNTIGNDEVSSVQVGAGCEVILYEDEDFRGRSIALYDDVEDLRATRLGQDTVSSLEVRCGRRGRR